MTPYTDKEFLFVLESVVAKDMFYHPIVEPVLVTTPSCDIKNKLHALDLDVVWVRAVMHAISQEGPTTVDGMLRDNVTLYELFDWKNTAEGWQFWEAISRLV